MYLTDILNDIHRIQYQVGNPFQGGASLGCADFPLTQVYTDADQLVVKAQVPGLTQDDLQLTITDDVLAISGEIGKTAAQAGEFKTLRRERKSGKFQKTIELPFSVDGARSEAVLKNGILTITFPLREETRPRQIAIKTQQAIEA